MAMTLMNLLKKYNLVVIESPSVTRDGIGSEGIS